MKQKELMKKYPLLIPAGAKILCAMESECETDGKIFDKLGEIFAEYPAETQEHCAELLLKVMQQICGYNSKSLDRRNSTRDTFNHHIRQYVSAVCHEKNLDSTLEGHMLCAVAAVMRSVNRRLTLENKHWSFYASNLSKNSTYFLKK